MSGCAVFERYSFKTEAPRPFWGFSKMDKSEEPSKLWIIWGLFFFTLLLHSFLFLIWQKYFFIYSFHNTHVFMDVVSSAYWKLRNSGHFFPPFHQFPRFGIEGNGVGIYWPPAVPVMGLWALCLLPTAWPLLPNIAYLTAAMLGIYYSTKAICSDRFCSMAGAIIFSFYWIVQIQLVSFELQLATAASVSWGFYFYLRSRFFTRLWPSLLTVFLTIFALYCDRATPGLFMAAIFLTPENFKTAKSRYYVLGAVIATLLFTCPFYIPWIQGQFQNDKSIATLFSQSGVFLSPAEVYANLLHKPFFLLAHFLYYFIAITDCMMGYAFTGYLICGLFSLPRLRKPFFEALKTAIGIPLTFFILIAKKDYAYIFPLCVYFAIISGIGIYQLKKPLIRGLLLAMAFVLFIFQTQLFFHPASDARRIYFSHFFNTLQAQKVPHLILSNYFPPENNIIQKLSSTAGQIKKIFSKKNNISAIKPDVFIDLKMHFFQHSLVFFLRRSFSELNVINGYFVTPAKTKIDCGESFMYLLSDKKKESLLDNVSKISDCSPQNVLPLYQLPESEIVLYRVQK